MSAQEGLVDRRIADLREANAVMFEQDRDASRDIERNNREIVWLESTLHPAITSLESELAEMRRDVEAFRLHEETLRANGIASHSEAVVRVLDAEQTATRLLASNARVRQHSERVLSFLDELAANAKPDQRKPLNSIIIGGSAKLIAEAFRAALAGHEQAVAKRACTCHPDDNPPVPCAEKYAYSECIAAPTMTAEPIFGGTEFCGHSMMRAICPTCSPASPGKGAE